MEKWFIFKRRIENTQTKRSFLWFFFFFGLIGLLFLWALFSSNVLFALFLVIFTILYWFLDQREQENKFLNIYLDEKKLKINEENLILKDYFISFDIFPAFLKEKNKHYKNQKEEQYPFLLRLDFKNRWRSSLFIPLKESEKELTEKVLLENNLKNLKKESENKLEFLKRILKI
ncbi:MAG: hypothetical protein ACPLXL_00135 [Minisyncoccia bacterium]